MPAVTSSPDPLAAIDAALAEALTRDVPALKRRLAGLRRRRRRGQPFDRGLAALERDLARSRARVEARRASLPDPRYPPELPVSARREDIARAIQGHQVVVVAGETGSGKTTQLPKICLELGLGARGLIGHTQPRRIAARSVAARIATELGTGVGRGVGFQVRFQDHTRADDYLKLMTDGILLAEIQGDPDLCAYEVLIIDEAHERSLNIDFLLGYLPGLLRRRPDLRLVITSATIDTERFARHFGGAPVVEVSGRSYPVELRYRPLVEAEDGDADPVAAILGAVDELAREPPGDVLVFLATEREIRDTAEALRRHHPPGTEILPLYARLSAAEQNRVFQPHPPGVRRIVLATNVAETSLTVPGIRYVVDPGRARVSRYSHRSKVQRLPVEAVSRASADQRAGRCGRVAPGVCIRLYSEEDYRQRPRFTEPEIQRTNLAAVILRMLDLGLGAVETFPFVDPPDRRFVNDGYRLLRELGAVDGDRRLTRLGRELARIPLDPRLGRMVLAARERGGLHEVLVIVSALTVQDPRERPLDARQRADQAHAAFRDKRSDFLGLLRLWQAWHEAARDMSRSALRRWCQRNFLSARRMQEWHDLYHQLANALKDAGTRIPDAPADEDTVHRALLAGLVGQIGLRDEEGTYLGSHGKRFRIFPGSALARRGPRWVMAAELVETSRLYARYCAPIRPEWVEELVPELLRREYGQPGWDARRGFVTAAERVTLYGLPLIQGRRVDFGRVDPAGARTVFLREALVEGRYRPAGPWLEHNLAEIGKVRALEARTRRRDLLVDEDFLYDFYDRRVPARVRDRRSFEAWRRQAEASDPALLRLDPGSLLRSGAAPEGLERFPDRLAVGGLTLPLEYHFEPGDPRDGVTVVVPLPALPGLPVEPLEWLVPGLLAEKITALIRGLPKALRRNFVPAPDFAAACARDLEPGSGPLLPALAAKLERMTGVRVPSGAWAPEALEPHLRMGIRVVDGEGTELAWDRDPGVLKARFSEAARESLRGEDAGDGFERPLRRWDFGDLPEEMEVERAGIRLRLYPAVVAGRDGPRLRLVESRARARSLHCAGLRALFATERRPVLRYLERNLPGIERICLHGAAFADCAGLRRQILDTALRDALPGEEAAPRTAAAWKEAADAAEAALPAAVNELCALVDRILAAAHDLRRRLKAVRTPAALEALADLRAQFDLLLGRDFVARTPAFWLRQFPRYLTAMGRRLDKLEQDPGRDRRLARQLMPLWTRGMEVWPEAAGEVPAGPEWVEIPEALVTYRWMLEEYRVNLFAQDLGTAVPVSPQRLDAQWEAFRGDG